MNLIYDTAILIPTVSLSDNLRSMQVAIAKEKSQSITSVRIVIIDFVVATWNDSLTSRTDTTLTHECAYRQVTLIHAGAMPVADERANRIRASSSFFASGHPLPAFLRSRWLSQMRMTWCRNPRRSGFRVLALRGTALPTGRANNNRLHSHDGVSAVTCYNGLANGSSFIPDRIMPQFASPRIPDCAHVCREKSVGGCAFRVK